MHCLRVLHRQSEDGYPNAGAADAEFMLREMCDVCELECGLFHVLKRLDIIADDVEEKRNTLTGKEGRQSMFSEP